MAIIPSERLSHLLLTVSACTTEFFFKHRFFVILILTVSFLFKKEDSIGSIVINLPFTDNQGKRNESKLLSCKSLQNK